MIVLDTNVLSELMRSQPAQSVIDWFDKQPATGLYVTSITQAEVLQGILRLPKGKRREAIAVAANEVFEHDFGGRILAFGSDAAKAYALIVSSRQRLGRPIAAFDAQIAGIAKCSGASVATRNVGDFEGCGIAILNPWNWPVAHG